MWDETQHKMLQVDCIEFIDGKAYWVEAKPAEFLLSNETGLTDEPAYSEDDDGESWSFSCLLQHRITTDAVIKVNSRNLNRTMVVDNGEHAYDGSSFLTTGVLK
ncbi:hypothetical protein LL940_06565 [Levilactobacillus brevis]|nr:hypothetical protein [Levilactobacillus brevis]